MAGLIFLDKLNFVSGGKPVSMDPLPNAKYQSEAATDMWDPTLLPLSQSTVVTGTAETYMRGTYFPNLLFKGGSSSNGPTPQIMIDIENWGWGDRRFHNAATVADSKGKFLQVIAIWRDVRPDLDIGCYNLGPLPNRDWAIGTAQEKADWKSDQDDFQDVFNALDTLYVTCYAPDDSLPWSQTQHIDFMDAAFIEARRLGPTKNIFAYVQPSHNTSPFGPINHEYFRAILDACKRAGDAGNCDGVVFWGYGPTAGDWQILIDAGLVDTINRFTRDWHV